MKDSQWAIAVGVLAALVFIIVFAGQYLGGGPGGPAGGRGGKSREVSLRELTFTTKEAPSDPASPPVEVEQKGHGHVHFFFVNGNDQPVKVGLIRSSCRCTEAELLLAPGDGPGRLAGYPASLTGQAAAGPLAAASLQAALWSALEASTRRFELKRDTEAVTVPAGAAGWVHLGWHADRPGPLKLDATLWMEDPTVGQQATLVIGTFAHEPFLVRPSQSFGTVREAALRDGVHTEVIVWSATRPSFRVAVNPGSLRTDPKSDPMEIVTPVPLTREERREMERRSVESLPGGVLSGWRVPLTLRAMAADGKTPCDIGPFKRTLLVSSPDFPATEPKQVSVTGRVRGVVEIGNDGESGDVNFGVFARKAGKSESINLSSEVPGLVLTVDRSRTAKFLTATLEPPQSVGGMRHLWKLKVAVKPGAAHGRFPRKDDAAYEDSAIYLTGSAPGQTPRTVRIAVFGSATEG